MGALDFQEAIDKIAAVAKEKGDDFIMRIFRKPTLTSPAMDTSAAFRDAQVAHFAMPEVWLAPFLGGGFYVLACVHANDPTVAVAMVIPSAILGAPKPPDFTVLAKPDWQGPKTLIYPKPAEVAEKSAYAALIPGPGAQPLGGADARGQFPGSGAGASSLDAVQAQFALINLQRQHDAERLEKMIESNAKAQERQTAALVESMKAIAGRPAPVAPPDKPLVEQIAPLLAAFTPLIAAFMTSRGDDAKRTVEREARREERESKFREEAAKAQASMFERLSNGNTETAKVMQSMADVVSNSLKGQIQMVATMREMTATDQPADEGGIVGVIKALGPALGDWLAAKATADATLAAARQPALPPRQPAVPPTPVVPPPAPLPMTGEAEEEEETDLATIPFETLLSEIEAEIKGHHAVAELAGAYLDAIAVNEGVRAAVNAAGGTIPFFRARLGDAWVFAKGNGPSGASNAAYLQSLVVTLTTTARERGITE
jgi:hypothetical protein